MKDLFDIISDYQLNLERFALEYPRFCVLGLSIQEPEELYQIANHYLDDFPELQERLSRALHDNLYKIDYFLSETDTLIELAGEIGLDRERFAADLASDATEDRLQEEIGLCRRLGMTGFPALVLDIDGSCWPLPGPCWPIRAS